MTVKFANRIASTLVVAASATMLSPTHAAAGSFTLEDLNSVLQIETEGDGVVDWVVNGVDHMFEEWFYIRVNGVDTRERALSSFDIVDEKATDSNFNPGNDTFDVIYDIDQLLDVEIKLSLAGTLCCGSDLGEQVTVFNKTTETLDISLFEYTDFDLNGTAIDTFAAFDATPTAGVFRQADGVWQSTTTATPRPTFWEISEFSDLRDRLEDDDIDNLTNSTTPFGPGDIVWAAQWDFRLGPDQSFQISKDKILTPVPLPAPAFMLIAAFAGLGALRASRKA